jgi:hypothetical protein
MIKVRAIQALRSGVGFTMINNDLSKITWDVEGTITPTESEVNAKIAELEAADAQAVIDKAAALASAEAKLAALGLTAAEVSALLSK